VKLIRHPADRWPVAYTLMVAVVQAALFAWVEPLWLAALLVLAFQPVQAVAIACNHYQHHKPVFFAAPLNRLYELLLFFQTGTPPFLITLHHNLGHHKHYLEPPRDTLRWQADDGRPYPWPVVMWRNAWGHLTWTVALGRRFPKIYRRLKLWTTVGLLVLAALVAWDPAKAAVVFLLPMLLQVLNVARLGYDQHAGLDMDDHLTASRNNESRLYNLVTFNSGYHTAHHLKPGLHWSELPAFHAEIRDGIPEELRGEA